MRLRLRFVLRLVGFTPANRCLHFLAAALNARCAAFGVVIFVPRILAIIHFLNFVFDPRFGAALRLRLAITPTPYNQPIFLLRDLRPFFFPRRVRFTTPRRGRHFFAAIRNARRADFIDTIFVPRILATRHFLYLALDPCEQTAAFRRLDFFLTILHRSRKFTDNDYRRLRAREVLRHLFEPFNRPYLHRRFPAFRRPTFRRLAGAFPASFLRHIFAARENALRAAFGVLNLMRLIAETIHFL